MLVMPLLAFSLIIGSLFGLWLNNTTISESITSSSTAGTTVETKKVYTVDDLPPELYRICSCESMQGGSKPPKHFDVDGSVMRGRVNPQDIGACQVNLKYHEAAATKKGLDLFKESDNLEYALWLYNKEGNTPWNWSRSCWGR